MFKSIKKKKDNLVMKVIRNISSDLHMSGENMMEHDSGYSDGVAACRESSQDIVAPKDVTVEKDQPSHDESKFSSVFSITEDQASIQGNNLSLRPLYFEVPGSESVLRRPKVLEDVKNILSRKNRGVVIYGKSGTGKTSVLVDMVKNSHFGCRASQSDVFHNNIVGYHFIEPADPKTTDVSRFIHSLAAQLTQHPGMEAYRDFLMSSSFNLTKHSLHEIRKNPSSALQTIVIEPLRQLYKDDEIKLKEAYILVDGLNHEAGKNILELIVANILRLPHWLKLIVTHTTADDNMIKLTHLPKIHLADYCEDDITEYVENRIFNSAPLINKLKPRKNYIICRIVRYILDHCDGNYMYPKLILDLLCDGLVTIKSSSFLNMPQNLSEAYHLLLSNVFPTHASYNVASKVMALCLASPRPLTIPQVRWILTRNLTAVNLSAFDFTKLSKVLASRSDGSLMFIHSDFISWITSSASCRFQLSSVDGHDMLIKYYSSVELKNTREALQFLYHLNMTSLIEQKTNYSDVIKYLYLKYKVDTKLLRKCTQKMSFYSFIDDDCIDQLRLAVGSGLPVTNLD